MHRVSIFSLLLASLLYALIPGPAVLSSTSSLTVQDIATGVMAPPAGIKRATPAPTRAALNADQALTSEPVFWMDSLKSSPKNHFAAI